MSKMIKVYRHRRNDTNEVFYVGIGKTEKRPYSKAGRNKHWKNIVNKAGYSVEIIAEVDTWEDACELEQFLIQEYGRRDLGTGPLVNMTDGGEGISNYTHSDETKDKMSKSHTGKFVSEEIRDRMSKAHKGKPSHRKGKTLSEESKIKMSEAKKGKKRSEETKAKISGKTIICTETGKIWHSISSCAIDNGLKRTTLGDYLNGKLKNKTTLKYI